MAKQKHFDNFLCNIEPSKTTKEYISSIQNNLRSYLKCHETYKDVHIDTFLSGSYAKHTSIRPVVGDNKRDVDIIVVTNYNITHSSKDVLKELKRILEEKDIYSKATMQSHSIGLDMSGISIDVVPVIEDSEDELLYYIGDSENGSWTVTDPKGHKVWSTKINTDNNSEYKPLVKIFKWWRHVNCPSSTKYPKGLALEKIIADNLGDSALSTEDFFLETMQNMVAIYKEDYVGMGMNPIIDDPSDKVDNNDLLSGYSLSDFSGFIAKIEEHINLLNSDGTTNDTWIKILGTEFPSDDSSSKNLALSNIEKCVNASHKQKLLWPMQRGGAAFISLQVETSSGTLVEYQSNGDPIAKGCSLRFKAYTGVKPPYKIMWQIVNTGDEAVGANCLRGNFEESDIGMNGKNESTSYMGSHSVQCFILKRNVCVAKSKEFIINIQ